MYFCGSKVNVMSEYNYIRDWVEDLPKKGKSVFSKEDVVRQFPDLLHNNVRNSLYRLGKKKKIQSVWHNFYAVILPEYGMRGIPPPTEYIDHLMNYLEKDYYVALLSAAAFQGAAHQQPMEFFVISNSLSLRDKHKDDLKINFFTKKRIPKQYITQLMTRSGYLNVSCPELTAFDLLIYEKSVGGINRVATVLSELAEVMNFENISDEFLKSLNVAVIQRLGYLLDFLDYGNLADQLLHKSKSAGIKFRKYPLSLLSKKKYLSDYQINDKWEISINEEIETDDL